MAQATESGNFELTLLSPERKLMDREAVVEVTLTGTEGEIQILAGHAPMIGFLETGPFAVRRANGERTVGVISSGFFETSERGLTVTAETIELPSEINVARARAAQLKAEEELRSPEFDEHRFRKYQLKLQRAVIRQQIAGS